MLFFTKSVKSFLFSDVSCSQLTTLIKFQTKSFPFYQVYFFHLQNKARKTEILGLSLFYYLLMTLKEDTSPNIKIYEMNWNDWSLLKYFNASKSYSILKFNKKNSSMK